MDLPITRPGPSRITSPLSPGYVARLVARFPRDIRLRDGSRLRVRELSSSDREQLKAFFSGCSSEALRYRFMSSIKAPSDSLLDYLAAVDGSRHVALIVTQGEGKSERIVAEGRYVRFNERPDAADIAFLVVEDMQRRGIASLLMEDLTEIAWRNGVTVFSADVLADNRPMLSLLRKTGHPSTISVSHGVIHLELPIRRGKDVLSEAA